MHDNEETTTQKHFALTHLTLGCEEITLGTADEVIHHNTFAWKEVVLLGYPLSIMNNQ